MFRAAFPGPTGRPTRPRRIAGGEHLHVCISDRICKDPSSLACSVASRVASTVLLQSVTKECK